MTNNIIQPGIIYILSILIILIFPPIIILFINTVLNIVIGRKAARCDAVIATATKDEFLNKDIVLGNKDITI